MLETRFADLDAAGAPSALADSLSNHSLVLGPAIADWEAVDLNAETVRLLANGTEIKRGAGNPGGEMVRLVVWLANVGTRWAGGLRTGQVVTTGSWTARIRPGRGRKWWRNSPAAARPTLRFSA